MAANSIPKSFRQDPVFLKRGSTRIFFFWCAAISGYGLSGTGPAILVKSTRPGRDAARKDDVTE